MGTRPAHTLIVTLILAQIIVTLVLVGLLARRPRDEATSSVQ
jgi:hypothetical protein